MTKIINREAKEEINESLMKTRGMISALGHTASTVETKGDYEAALLMAEAQAELQKAHEALRAISEKISSF